MTTNRNRDERRVIHRVASMCLSYPDDRLMEDLAVLHEAVIDLTDREARTRLLGMLDHLETTPLGALQREYVEVFDLSRKHALYLSYWTDGDTRRRGEVLGGFKSRYRASGFLVNTHGELPDFLPLVLEYAAVADPDDGLALLVEYRPSLELLKFGLMEAGTPYAAVVQSVCATLPGASPADAAEVHRMAAAGPPTEQVGLDPYGGPLLPLVQRSG